MPIYEYRCRDCGEKSTFITLSIKSPFEARCKRCRSRNLEKIISRVAVFRSEEGRIESLADPSKLTDLNEKDPKSVARWMKKMGKEMGEDLGEDFDRAAEEAAEEGKETGEGQDEGEV
jgi:putative FmdB family regulatory protein